MPKERELNLFSSALSNICDTCGANICMSDFVAYQLSEQFAFTQKQIAV